MTKHQQAVGEMFYGFVETFCGQKRTSFLGNDFYRVEYGNNWNFTATTPNGNWFFGITVKPNGDVIAAQVRPSRRVRADFIANSFRIAMELLLSAK